MCIECEDNIPRDLIDLKRCSDCLGFFCLKHIQEKENKGWICISCELEVVDSFYRQREIREHPQYTQQFL